MVTVPVFHAARASRASFGYLRAFDDEGQEIGQLVAEQGTIIADLALTGDQLRLLLRPFAGVAAGVVDVPVPGNVLVHEGWGPEPEGRP